MTPPSLPTGPSLPTDPAPPTDGRPTIRASQPGDVLGVVPYLLGFLPADDLVLVLMARSTVVLTARADLGSVPTSRELVDMIEELADLHGGDSVVVIGYHRDAAPVDRLFEGVVDQVDGVRVVDLLHVDGERWYSRLCRSGCCPAEGTRYDLSTSRTAAEAVYAGLSALPSREDLHTLTEPDPPDPALRSLYETVAEELLPPGGGAADAAVAMAARLVRSGVPATDRECAELAVAMFDIDARHRVWLTQSRATAASAVRLWAQVARRCVDPFRTAPLCQLATAAWLSGDGALMSVCLEALETSDPDNRLVRTIDTINRLALPPSWWDETVDAPAAADLP